jgi:hypothetical protein
VPRRVPAVLAALVAMSITSTHSTSRHWNHFILRASVAQLEAGIDARAERYWQLVGVINGWPPHAALVPTFEWMIAALRAHG